MKTFLMLLTIAVMYSIGLYAGLTRYETTYEKAFKNCMKAMDYQINN